MRLGVVGAGTMGRGIAQVAAGADLDVTLVDAFPAVLQQAVAAITARITPEQAGRLRSDSQLSALTAVDAVIEAVPEDPALKRQVFEQVRGVNPGARLYSNTSSLPVASLGADVVGLHFFNPPWRMALVEVVRPEGGDPTRVEEAVALARLLGKTPVVVRDTPGFVVNRCARPFYLEGMRIVGDGLATVEAVDRILHAAGFPMGPFQLMDLIGTDVNLAVSRSVWEALFQPPRLRPHPLQKQLVDAGRLGRKSGRGWYDDSGRRDAGPGDASLPGAAGRPVVGAVLGAGRVADDLRASLEQRRDGLGGMSAKGREAVLALAADIVLLAGPGVTAEEIAEIPAACPVGLFSAYGTAVDATRACGRPAFAFSYLPPWAGARVVEFSVGPEGPPADEVAAALRGLGREVVEVGDAPGHVALRVVAQLAAEAAQAVAEGVAAPRDIDTALRLGVNYPQGPVAWGASVGYEVLLGVLDGLTGMYGDAYRPARLLRRWAAGGAPDVG